jgi:6-phosphogluconolactonase (cycloisomerase 2 family)
MRFARVTSLVALLAACADSDSLSKVPLAPSLAVDEEAAVGQVYTMTNQVAGNTVLAFDRAANGALTPAGSYPTGGTGTGGGLGNQGAVVLSSDGEYLITVNAGSNTVSTFRVRANGSLAFRGSFPSGGVRPVSVTEQFGLVYVLNAGDTGNITGFRRVGGVLTMIPNSTRPLSSPAAGASQVEFARRASVLIVTEKATNNISTYSVREDGTTVGPRVIPSNGQTPFGFGVRGSLLIVSEAFGGAAGASASSSYDIGSLGQLTTISASVGTGQSAACWIVITNDGRFAYTTNTASNTISAYRIRQGRLTLEQGGISASTDGGPIDLALSRNGRFLYSLNGAGHTITGFEIGANGTLTSLGAGASALPTGTNGLVAR